MDTKSSFVDPAELEWRATPYDGVEWKKLRFDAATGESAVLIRFAPGAAYGAHLIPPVRNTWCSRESWRTAESATARDSTSIIRPVRRIDPQSPGGCLIYVTLPAPIETLD